MISPIGEVGTERYAKFKEVLEYVIKSAVKATGYELQVLRADDIDRPGSFIKDILENLYSSFVVIADLTEQSPNVFYELGVRHSLSPRTIMIAQTVDDIPSDLREYRTIVYDTSAKGASEFADRLKKFLTEIYQDTERPDNPVLDRIGGMAEDKIAALESENKELKKELDTILRKGAPKRPAEKGATSVRARVDRVLKLRNAEQQPFKGRYVREDRSYALPGKQGDFDLYFLQYGTSILDTWYVADHSSQFEYQEDLADVRVLMENCCQQGETACTFIIATVEDLSGVKKNILDMFGKMKSKLPAKCRGLFNLAIWDRDGLLAVERELGLKIEP